MSDPFDWSKPSFSLGEQPHRKLKQAGQLEVKKKQREMEEGHINYFERQQMSSKTIKTFKA